MQGLLRPADRGGSEPRRLALVPEMPLRVEGGHHRSSDSHSGGLLRRDEDDSGRLPVIDEAHMIMHTCPLAPGAILYNSTHHLAGGLPSLLHGCEGALQHNPRVGLVNNSRITGIPNPTSGLRLPSSGCEALSCSSNVLVRLRFGFKRRPR